MDADLVRNQVGRRLQDRIHPTEVSGNCCCIRLFQDGRRASSSLVNPRDCSLFLNGHILRDRKIPHCGGLPLGRAHHPLQKTVECVSFGGVCTMRRNNDPGKGTDRVPETLSHGTESSGPDSGHSIRWLSYFACHRVPARRVIKEAGNDLGNAHPSGHSQCAGRILFDRSKSYR
jgi:hypothetical protein